MAVGSVSEAGTDHPNYLSPYFFLASAPQPGTLCGGAQLLPSSGINTPATVGGPVANNQQKAFLSHEDGDPKNIWTVQNPSAKGPAGNCATWKSGNYCYYDSSSNSWLCDGTYQCNPSGKVTCTSTTSLDTKTNGCCGYNDGTNILISKGDGARGDCVPKIGLGPLAGVKNPAACSYSGSSAGCPGGSALSTKYGCTKGKKCKNLTIDEESSWPVELQFDEKTCGGGICDMTGKKVTLNSTTTCVYAGGQSSGPMSHSGTYSICDLVKNNASSTHKNGKGCNNLNQGLKGKKCDMKGLGVFCMAECETCGWDKTSGPAGFTVQSYGGWTGYWPHEDEMCSGKALNPLYTGGTGEKNTGKSACAGQFKLTNKNKHARD